jgi:hypothetical protein
MRDGINQILGPDQGAVPLNRVPGHLITEESRSGYVVTSDRSNGIWGHGRLQLEIHVLAPPHHPRRLPHCILSPVSRRL